eukprot:m.222056 g.222056  ORF g.222056 m.222056 type:complete len:1073 (+) comp33360_c0_seq3:76-3294(+)
MSTTTSARTRVRVCRSLLLAILLVGSGSYTIATACRCESIEVMPLSVGATCLPSSDISVHGKQVVFTAFPNLCLSSSEVGSAILLPCRNTDLGQIWSFSPFNGSSLLNEATLTCLTLDAVTQSLTVSSCQEPAIANGQGWSLVQQQGSTLLRPDNGTVSTTLCVQPTKSTVQSPCYLNDTLMFDSGSAPPSGATLGTLPSEFSGDITMLARVYSNKNTRNTPWSRILDLGNGSPGDNVLLAHSGVAGNMIYQIYHGDHQLPTPPSINSRDLIPEGVWFVVAIVQSGQTATMFWNLGEGWEVQATGPMPPPSAVVRTSNFVGVSNWAGDAAFSGLISDVWLYTRALSKEEIYNLDYESPSTTAPVSTGVDICAKGPPLPPPSPPESVSISLDISRVGPVVEPELYGHDLEFTRHDLFEGLSAELIANRKFALPTKCDGSYACWPKAVQELIASGIVPRWQAIGAATLAAPWWSNNSFLVTGDNGHSIRCSGASRCGVQQQGYYDGFNSAMSFGSAIAVKMNDLYSLRVVLQANGTTTVPVTIVLSSEGNTLLTHTFSVAATSQWETYTINFTASVTSTNATLAITSPDCDSEASQTDSQSKACEYIWGLGTVSLTPVANTWRGMRVDTITALKEIGFKGLFRYPGGCYAPFYRWKIGLLPPDQRPPIETPPSYCAAVPGGVNAYTDGFMENGIGIDDYLALCDKVGLAPSVTVRFQTGGSDEVTEATDWVEYLNGDASTTWGKIRAQRGHPDPYNVSYFYLGNEISQQARYPDYPQNTTILGPPSSSEYQQMLLNIVQPMLDKSPSLPLKLLTVSASASWNKAWISSIGEHVAATSFHAGYMNQPSLGQWTEQAVTTCAKRPQSDFINLLTELRATLDIANGSHIAISADEWGLGPPWDVEVFSVTHGMYAAGFLGAITRAAPDVNLKFTNYFEPVNEGAIQVFAFNATVTPVGQVMRMFAQHQDGIRVQVPAQAYGGNLDMVATMQQTTTSRVVHVTASNLNAVGWSAIALTLTIKNVEAAMAQVQTLRAQGFTPSDFFDAINSTVPISADGKMELVIPPFSVVHVAMSISK